MAAFSAYTDEELAWLYVAPKAMGQGIGKKLVAQALATAPGIQSIEVLRGNEPARKLYEAFGFYLEKTEKGVMPGNEAFEVEVYCMRRG